MTHKVQPVNSRSAIHFRHNKKSNVSFLDGHSKKLYKDNARQYGFQSGYSETWSFVITQ